MNDITDMDIAHLAGYVDGKARITVHIMKNDRYSLGYEFRPLIRISISDEKEAILGKLEAYCESVGVKCNLSHNEERSIYVFEVRDPDSLHRFLGPLMDHMVAQFDEGKLMLTQLVPGIQADKHLEKEGFIRLLKLSEPIRTKPKKGPARTAEDFEEMWDVTPA